MENFDYLGVLLYPSHWGSMSHTLLSIRSRSQLSIWHLQSYRLCQDMVYWWEPGDTNL